MSSITEFEVTSKEAVYDIKEFCRLKDELTYLGQFANKTTCEVIPGEIIKYDNKFYTTELCGTAGFSSMPAAESGMVKTVLCLFKTNEYNPEKCKLVAECSICIGIWDINIDDEAPIVRYAFSMHQLEEARKIVRANKDVEICVNGEQISRTRFLKKFYKKFIKK